MMLWIVGKVLNGDPAQWEFQGVFSTEEIAKSYCVGGNFFIGPASLDNPFPVEKVEWTGAYYPNPELPVVS
jgi:hypothetical protein